MSRFIWSKAFNAWMVLGAAFYWWVVDVWAWHWWIRLVSYLIGPRQFRSLEQQFIFRIQHAPDNWSVIDSFLAFLSFVFFCFAVIPVYVCWAYWYRRRESYLGAIGGVEDV
jgi:hypothetical protein